MAQSLLTSSIDRFTNKRKWIVRKGEVSFFSFVRNDRTKCSDFINTQKTFSSRSVTGDMKLQTMKWTPKEDVSIDIRLKEYKLLQIESEKPQTKDVTPLNHEQYHDQPSLFRIEHINLTTFGNYFSTWRTKRSELRQFLDRIRNRKMTPSFCTEVSSVC